MQPHLLHLKAGPSEALEWLRGWLGREPPLDDAPHPEGNGWCTFSIDLDALDSDTWQALANQADLFYESYSTSLLCGEIVYFRSRKPARWLTCATEDGKAVVELDHGRLASEADHPLANWQDVWGYVDEDRWQRDVADGTGQLARIVTERAAPASNPGVPFGSPSKDEPRHVKLIRAMCDRMDERPVALTTIDTGRIHQGQPTTAWHFVTHAGAYHLIEADGNAIVFRGDSTTDRVHEYPAVFADELHCLTQDSTQHARNPGNTKLDPWTWLRYYPQQPLLLALSVPAMAAASLVAGHWDWKYAAFGWAMTVGLLANNWIHWLRIRERFLYGCANTAVVVSLDPPLIAVSTDLSKGERSFPVVKIIRQRLSRPRNDPLAIGTRLTTVSLYHGAHGPQWSDFHPLPLECATTDPKAIARAFRTFNESDWDRLARWLAQVPKPYKPGLFPIDDSAAPADLDALRTATATAVRDAASAFRDASGRSRLAGFALCTDDDVRTLYHVVYTQEELGENEDPDARFLFTEWTQSADDAPFDRISEQLEALADREQSEEQWEIARDARFNALVWALRDVRRQGLFVLDTLLGVSSTDPSDHMASLAMDSADTLNTPELANRFAEVAFGVSNRRNTAT